MTREASEPRSRRWSLTSLLTLCGLLATNIVALYGAFYLVVPRLEPRERLGASITSIVVEQDVPFVDYAALLHAGDLEVETYDTSGSMIFVSASIAGFTDRSYAIAIDVLEGGTNSKITGSRLRELHRGVDGPFNTCETRTIAAEEDNVAWRCWVVDDVLPQQYSIVAKLYDAGVRQQQPDEFTLDTTSLMHFMQSTTLTRTDTAG